MPEINVDKIKQFAPIGAAGVLGLAAAGIGWMLVSSSGNGPVQQIAAVDFDEIVVAARDLPAGYALTADDLTFMKVESGSTPSSAFADISSLVEAVGEDGTARPRVLTHPVSAGQPVMALHLAEEETPEGLAALVQPGMRAISIQVDSAHGLKGMLLAGSRVDIVATVSAESDTIARTVAQDVLVLAVGGVFRDAPKATVEDEDDPYKNPEDRGRDITLMVTPEQAARIDLAFASGRPRLVLRGGGDRELSPFTGLTLAELAGLKKDDPQAFDPWGGNYNEQPYEWEPSTVSTDPEPAAPVVIDKAGGAKIVGAAGIDLNPIATPSTDVPSAEGDESVQKQPEAPSADPTQSKPQPDPRPTVRPRPAKPRTVEIIRGGVSSVEVVPPPSKKSDQNKK